MSRLKLDSEKILTQKQIEETARLKQKKFIEKQEYTEAIDNFKKEFKMDFSNRTEIEYAYAIYRINKIRERDWIKTEPRNYMPKIKTFLKEQREKSEKQREKE